MVSRTVTAAVKTEVAKSSGAKRAALLKIEIDSGTEFLWTGRGPIVFSGDTYNGLGEFGKISVVEEGVEQRSFDVTIEISGIPASRLSDALNEDIQGRAVTVYDALLDDNWAIVADPLIAFRGRLDTMDVKLGDTATIQVRAVNLLEDWERHPVGRYTNADQLKRFAGDLGLEFTSDAVEKEIAWGASVA